MDFKQAAFARLTADQVAKKVFDYLGIAHALEYETNENLKDDVYCAVAAAITYEEDQKDKG
jgi:hypothetical protein